MERTDRARGQTHSSRCLFIEQSTRSFFFLKLCNPPPPSSIFFALFLKRKLILGWFALG